MYVIFAALWGVPDSVFLIVLFLVVLCRKELGEL